MAWGCDLQFFRRRSLHAFRSRRRQCHSQPTWVCFTLSNQIVKPNFCLIPLDFELYLESSVSIAWHPSVVSFMYWTPNGADAFCCGSRHGGRTELPGASALWNYCMPLGVTLAMPPHQTMIKSKQGGRLKRFLFLRSGRSLLVSPSLLNPGREASPHKSRGGPLKVFDAPPLEFGVWIIVPSNLMRFRGQGSAMQTQNAEFFENKAPECKHWPRTKLLNHKKRIAMRLLNTSVSPHKTLNRKLGPHP